MVVCDAFCADMSVDDLVTKIVSEAPDVVGLNCSTHTFLDAVEVLERVRQALPESRIVLGGYHATFAAENILRNYSFIDLHNPGGGRALPRQASGPSGEGNGALGR